MAVFKKDEVQDGSSIYGIVIKELLFVLSTCLIFTYLMEFDRFECQMSFYTSMVKNVNSACHES